MDDNFKFPLAFASKKINLGIKLDTFDWWSPIVYLGQNYEPGQGQGFFGAVFITRYETKQSPRKQW